MEYLAITKNDINQIQNIKNYFGMNFFQFPNF